MPVVVTARGTLTTRRGWWLELVDASGRTARGEAAPLPAFGGETPDRCLRALTAWVQSATGTVWSRDIGQLTAELDACDLPPVARAAVCQALWQLCADADGVCLADLISDNAARRLPPSHHLVATVEAAVAAVAVGATALKIKVGGAPAVDLARLHAIAAAVGGACELRLDANGGWSTAQVVAIWPALRALQIRWIEEPCDLSDPRARVLLRALRASGGPAVLADESCRDVATLDRIAADVDGVVIKPMLCGGLDRAAALADRAAALGLGVVVTTSFGTALDLATGIAVARTAQTLWGCGLDPAHATVRPKAAADQTVLLPAVPHPVFAAARQRPDHLALSDGQRTWTWRQVAAAVATRAEHLATVGVRTGDVVSVRGPQTGPTALWLHAVTWCGAVLAPVDPHAPAATQLRQLRALDPDFLLDLSAHVTDVDGHAPQTARWRTLRPPPDDDRRHGGDDTSYAPAPWPLDATRLRLCTSGSTGSPRAVNLSTGQLLASTFGSTQRLGHVASDVWWCCLPLHHAGGLSILLRTAWLATTTELRARFDPRALAAAIVAGSCTQVSLVPAWLHDLLAHWPSGARPHPRFRLALVGGAALTQTLRDGAAAVGLPLAETWGLTEAGSQVATRAPWDAAPAGPGTPLCIADVHANEAGSTPRLRVTGPLVAGGALQTSDCGHIADGQVVVDGRADACFQSGGELIDPAALARVLRRHPAVRDAVVVGLPHERLGQRTAALLVLHPTAQPIAGAADATNTEATEATVCDAVQRWIAEQVRGFVVPQPIAVAASVPRTALGKVDHAAVCALLAARPDTPRPDTARSGDERPKHHRRELAGDEVGGERGPQRGGDRDRSAAAAVHADVHVADDDMRLIPRDLEAQAHGGPADAFDPDADDELVAEPHRGLVVSLGVHQRHDPGLRHQDLGQRQPDLAEQALKSRVGDLERPGEEDDAGGVDLGESNEMVMVKLHGDDSVRDAAGDSATARR